MQCVLIRDPGAALTGEPFLAFREPLHDNILVYDVQVPKFVNLTS